jgi:carboxyl-terminal processing protease
MTAHLRNWSGMQRIGISLATLLSITSSGASFVAVSTLLFPAGRASAQTNSESATEDEISNAVSETPEGAEGGEGTVQNEDDAATLPASPTKPAGAEPSPVEELAQENETYRSLESFSRAIGLLEEMYVDPEHVSPEEMIDKALRGIVSSLDPHTTYLSARELKDFTSDTTGRFGGIGVIIINDNGRLRIVEVVEDSPGEKAGLKKGDIIFSVGDLELTKSTVEEGLSRLKGLPGSAVTIQVWKLRDQKSQTATNSSGTSNDQKRDTDEALTKQSGQKAGSARPSAFDLLPPGVKPKLTTITLKRAVIRTPNVKHVKLGPGYAYVAISIFQEDTGEQVDKALRKHEAENGGRLDGLILDLRGNPGGLLDQAVRICDLFLDSGIIVSTIGRNREKPEVEFATKRTTHPHTSMIVLVNEGSASASEIVAGALQDHERALVLGTQTFGKGSVQSIIPLPNGGGLKMTIARYYTPKGRSIQAKGITPDIPVAGGEGQMAPGQTDAVRRPLRRESDLKGHIQGEDIADKDPITTFQADMAAWPDELQEDHQLRVAYTYLKSWSRFAPKTALRATSAKNEKSKK